MVYNVPPQGFGSYSVTYSNPNNIVYISGSENTDGSIRLSPTLDDIAKVERRTDGAWQDTGIRLSGESLYLGHDLSVSALANVIATKSDSSGAKKLSIQESYTDTGNGEIEVPILGIKIIEGVTQFDDSESFTGKQYGYTFTVSEDTFISKIYYKFGTTVPTNAQLDMTAYVGVDATGERYFKQSIPASDLLANSKNEIDLIGGLGYIYGQNIFVSLTCDEDFEIVTNASKTSPWRAYDYWGVSYDSSMHAPAWSAKEWTEGDWCINDGLIYVCNVTGLQAGSFETNSEKWNQLGCASPSGMTYMGGITIAEFNALDSGANGDYYRFTDSGTLVGGESANTGDTVIINKTLTATITSDDYDYFSETLNGDVFYQTGRPGGQTAAGGTGDSENLVITSTAHANKGVISLGDSKYDEPKNILGIGGDPNDSAVITLTSTDKGFLLPRMTESERDLIVAPAIGLIIYQTNNSPGLYYYDGAWKPVNRPVGFDEMVYLTHVTKAYDGPYDGVSIQAVTRWDYPVRVEQRIEIFKQYRMISQYLNGFEVIIRPNVSYPEYPYYDSVKCNIPGLYKISYDLSYDNDTPKSKVFVQMTVNDTVVANSVFDFESLYALASNHISTVIQLNDGDVIDVRLGGFSNEYCTINSDHLDIIRIK